MSSSGIPVFWMEKSDRVQVALRRFTFAEDRPCRGSQHGHDASHTIEPDAPASAWVIEHDSGTYEARQDVVSRDDPRWPAACEHCGEPFQADDEWRASVERLYRRADTGALHPLRKPPVGAMWDADWLHDYPTGTGSDGIALHVQTPGGTWHVDGEASNCTRKQRETRADGKTYLTARTHYCWCRHGDPRDPQGATTGQPLHVDKQGDTCSAGAGSIACGAYHGFLHHGRLTNA